MSRKDTSKDDEKYYLIDNNRRYEPLVPSPLENLLTLYGLEPIAQSLARTNPDGSKGVKLRKSFKNHIQDLPGKHQIPPAKAVPNGIMDPEISNSPDLIKAIDQDLLNKALQFEKTSVNGIPGFNSSDLAINDQKTLMRGDDMSETEDSGFKRSKRKKKSQTIFHDIKRQHV